MSSAGLLSGLGRGLALSGERMLKNVDRDAEREYQAARDAKQNQFTVDRDTRMIESRAAENEVEHRRRIEATKEAVLFQKGLSDADQLEAKRALDASGGDPVKAFSEAKTAGAKDALEKLNSLREGKRKTDSSLETDKAQRAASGASTANAYDSIAGRREDRTTKAQDRADEAKARDMLANFTRATQDGNTDAAQVLRTEYIRLTGEDPATTKGGDWTIHQPKNKYGENTGPGLLLNKNNAEVRPMPNPAALASGQVTKAQVDAAARAKGITDPKELKRLYATYGVQ